jgi:oligopeptide transport system substrate-binding protein
MRYTLLAKILPGNNCDHRGRRGHKCESIHTSLRTGALALLLLALSVLLSGCTTGQGNGNGGNGGAGALPTGNNANVLRYALIDEPTTLDPAKVEDGTTIDLLQQVYEGLVRWSENNEIEPNLAEKWEVSEDGTTYTFHLKKGVKFHNGREVTAEDFKYSIERACAPKLASPTVPNYLKDIVGVKECLDGKATTISGITAPDAQTLVIKIDKLRPYWLGNMTYPCSYVVPKEDVDKNGGPDVEITEKNMVGTGPFKIGEFRRGYQVSLVANPDYHEGKPKIDGIVRPIIKEGITRLNKYEAGELDIVDVSPRDLDRINNDPNLKNDLKSFARNATWYVGLNSAASGSPFGDVRVRQAFAHAIDRDETLRVAMKGQADVATGIVPPGFPNYKPKITMLAYDPAKAKQLLAAAGFPDGKGFPELTFSFRRAMPQVEQTAQVLAEQLKRNLNINVQLRPMEWGQFLNERTNKTMPLSHLRWGADYLDPQNFLSTLLHTSVRDAQGRESHPENGVGYSNPEFDKLCDAADVEKDPKKRMALYEKAEQIAINDAPWVPLYFQRDLELVRSRVGNLKDSLFGHRPHIVTTVTP